VLPGKYDFEPPVPYSTTNTFQVPNGASSVALRCCLPWGVA
jgi:hypothetical protein